MILAGVPWTSGKVAKDFDVALGGSALSIRPPSPPIYTHKHTHAPLPAADSLPAIDTSISVIALTTPHGVIRIRLKPDWSQSSVEYVRRVAATGSLCTPQCEFYRAEPGFLLQVRAGGGGGLEARGTCASRSMNYMGRSDRGQGQQDS